MVNGPLPDPESGRSPCQHDMPELAPSTASDHNAVADTFENGVRSLTSNRRNSVLST